MLKKTIPALLPLLVFSSLAIHAQGVDISWQKEKIDGHRTGVVASNASNVEESMGTISRGTYHAPNGKKFRKGTVPKVARIMLDAQPRMAEVKQVIGYSTEEMPRVYPECALYDWFVDELMRATSDSTGRKVDIGFTNRGGVRVDMPQGQILLDDIMSMFPFKNNLCYVSLKGRDVRKLLDQMASTSFQIIGGIKVVAKNGKILSATIDGQPLDDDKVYGLATINFLLDGGDGYRVAENAIEVIHCNGWIYDTMTKYVRELTAEGKPVAFENKNWITILKEGEGE